MYEIYGKQNCGFCTQAVQLLEAHGLEYKKYIIDENITREEFVQKFPDVRTVPLIFHNENRLGGFQALKEHLDMVN